MERSSLTAIESTSASTLAGCIRLVPSLRFYLALGCEARQSGDGWARLRNAGTVFVLEQGVPGGRPGAVQPVTVRQAGP